MKAIQPPSIRQVLRTSLEDSSAYRMAAKWVDPSLLKHLPDDVEQASRRRYAWSQEARVGEGQEVQRPDLTGRRCL